MFREPTDEDFEALNRWGMADNPLAAIDDYSPLKSELRWLNPYQRQAHDKYMDARKSYIEQEDFDDYYRRSEKPIDKRRWEFLKLRKAWYICPVEWDRFAEPGVRRILDFGCGDGDLLQRVADHIAACWAAKDYPGHDLELLGVDLNGSRIENAKAHTASPHPNLAMRFEVGDGAHAIEKFDDASFDYALATGVFEILDEDTFERISNELARIISKGLYTEDIVDSYPGGFPREDVADLLRPLGLDKFCQHYVLKEPFCLEGSLDPMEIWGMVRVMLTFYEKQ